MKIDLMYNYRIVHNKIIDKTFILKYYMCNIYLILLFK